MSRGGIDWVQVLLKMGQPDKAQTVYQLLLEQETEENAKGPLYGQLGYIKDILGNMRRPLNFTKNHLQLNNNQFLRITLI